MNDRKLILACQNGEKQAFDELITLYYPFVSKFLLKLTQNETISEDLVQETFIKLIRHIEQFDVNGKATFSTYLMTIARNSYIDYLRKEKHILISIEELEVADSSSFEEKLINQMEADEVLKEIEKLPSEQAQAIKLKYMEQLTLIEIAERLKTQPKTIKSRIHEGMVKLRNSLNKGGV